MSIYTKIECWAFFHNLAKTFISLLFSAGGVRLVEAQDADQVRAAREQELSDLQHRVSEQLDALAQQRRELEKYDQNQHSLEEQVRNIPWREFGEENMCVVDSLERRTCVL